MGTAAPVSSGGAWGFSSTTVDSYVAAMVSGDNISMNAHEHSTDTPEVAISGGVSHSKPPSTTSAANASLSTTGRTSVNSPWSSTRAVLPPSAAATEAGGQLQFNQTYRYVASVALVCLLLVCVAWEGFIAPLKPEGSWLVLKALPLLLPLRGVLRGRLYTYQWASMLVLLYVMEGAVRVVSDTDASSVFMAGLELLFALVFFVAAIAYVRPSKKHFKQQKKRVDD